MMRVEESVMSDGCDTIYIWVHPSTFLYFEQLQILYFRGLLMYLLMSTGALVITHLGAGKHPSPIDQLIVLKIPYK